MERDPDQPSANAGAWKRVGPMTWVPELSVRPGDPWAHRKGEPRPFAALWAVYLMASALLTIFALRSIGVPTTQQFVFACRCMLVMTSFGLAVLWPMVRLSQVFPSRGARSLLGDMAVLMLPVQALLWPMPLLTHWRFEVVAALALLLVSWMMLVSGVLMLAYAGGGHGAGAGRTSVASRTGWMLLVIALAAVPGLVGALGPAPLNEGGAARVLLLFSPVGGVFALTGAPSGLSPVMTSVEWLVAGLPAMVGGALWVLARAIRARPEQAGTRSPVVDGAATVASPR